MVWNSHEADLGMIWSSALRKPLVGLLILAGFPFDLTPLRAVSMEIEGEAWGRYESNASNSDAPGDQLADGFFGTRIALGSSGVFARDWRWRAHLVGKGELAVRFWELGFLEGGTRLGLERKFGLGWQAPRLQADFLSVVRGDGQPGASGVRLAPSLAFVWQAGEQWGLSLRYVPEWFLAQSVVFDSFSNTVGVAGWFDLFPATRLKVGYDFRYGDVNSYAVPPRPDLVAVAAARQTTDVFGAERVVYRIEAATQTVEAALSQDVTDHLRLQASYRWEITQGQGLVYENHIVEFRLRGEF